VCAAAHRLRRLLLVPSQTFSRRSIEPALAAVEVELPVDDGEALVDLFGDLEHPLPARLGLEGHAAHWLGVRRKGRRLPP
jgi:hypothetical protein